MFAEPFDTEDGYRIWLDLDETDQLLAAADSREERIAFALGVRSGLRVQEIVNVEAKDVVSTSAGPRVRVWHSKGKQYRETPTTKDILAMAETVADLQGDETRLVEHSTRWVQRHLDSVTGELADDDEMWQYVTPHDLRRTWATLMSADIDDPLLIMDFGGWEDIETFLEHYRGSYSPAVQRRELSSVDWLDIGARGVGEREPELAMLDGERGES
jgi:Phage integrase family.